MQITSLDAAVDDDGFVDAPPGERVAMVYELTLAAWALSGRPMPTYSRAEIPGRLIRGDSSP
jgi:hypothetical protein